MYWRKAVSTILGELLLRSSLGLITDVDGTISPIVADPDSAQVTPRNRELLGGLQKALPLVAIISGRAAQDIADRVGIEGLVYVGNHGLERWEGGRVHVTGEAGSLRPAIQAVLGHLEAIVSQVPGIFVEDKGVTLSIHYRQTSDPKRFVDHYLKEIQDIADKHHLRLFQGRMVIEIRPPVEKDKGSALDQLIKEYKLEAAVYLGDDTTDVAAFQMARKLRENDRCFALGMGVLSDGVPNSVVEHSDVWVHGVLGVEEFLNWLLESLRASST